MFANTLRQRNTRRWIAGIVSALLVVMAVLALGGGAQIVLAQATDTPTPTNTFIPTSTLTVTPTPTNTSTPTTTPYPLSQQKNSNSPLQPVSSILCAFDTVGYDCLQGRGGGSIHLYASNGAEKFSVNGETGAVSAGALSVNSLSLATPQAVLAYQTPGVRMKCGTNTITGTLAIAHGMATPQFVMANLAADVNGDHARVSSVNASATVTIKIWNSALTPAAAQTPVAVDWCVVGVP